MLGPKVEIVISTKSGNCNQTKEETGTQARRLTGITIHGFPRSITKRAAENATIMDAMEINKVRRPIISFRADARSSIGHYEALFRVLHKGDLDATMKFLKENPEEHFIVPK
ncbi:hypothetical protein PIB30_014533 [Stylosanthes scabra]|uniref:Uncharacterized protein n=1 Tax=Stylosanthes scabra TaxID=79078 RepID=A0ABU6Y4X9_9FABA|nr:hypothetical protein [Stylosanthes scabra]